MLGGADILASLKWNRTKFGPVSTKPCREITASGFSNVSEPPSMAKAAPESALLAVNVTALLKLTHDARETMVEGRIGGYKCDNGVHHDNVGGTRIHSWYVGCPDNSDRGHENLHENLIRVSRIPRKPRLLGQPDDVDRTASSAGALERHSKSGQPSTSTALGESSFANVTAFG